MKRFTLLAIVLVPLAACSSSSNNSGSSPDASTSHADANHGSNEVDAAEPADAAVAIDAAGSGSGSGSNTGSNGWPALAAIPMETPDQTFWGVTVNIGTQSFVMDVDTGSTTIGVAGSTCTKCTSAGVSPVYTPDATAVDKDGTTDTTYEDNSGWSGEVYSDTIGLGNGTPSLTLEFGDMTTETKFFDGNSTQGIFGMGALDNIAEGTATSSYFDSAAANGMEHIMAFELCASTGTMWLGGFDQTHASSAPQYTPLLAITPGSQDLASNPYYSVTVDNMGIGGVSIGSGSATYADYSVVDTGTTLFYLPTSVYNKAVTTLEASTGYKTLFGTKKFNANTGCVTATSTSTTAAMVDATLPAFTISMPKDGGGADIVVSAKPMESYLYTGDSNGQFCLAIQDGGTEDPTTMGDAIMRAFVTIIDEKNMRVGWAPDSGCASSPNELEVHRPINVATFHPHLPKPRHHHPKH